MSVQAMIGPVVSFQPMLNPGPFVLPSYRWNSFDDIRVPPPEPDSKIWQEIKGLPVRLKPTGRCDLDSALASGFDKYWTRGRWKWIEDTSVLSRKPDSSFLVFGSVQANNYTPKNLFRDCEPGTTFIGGSNCSAPDSATLFYLALLRPDSSRVVLHQALSELRSQTQFKSKFASTTIRDFHDAVTPQVGASVPNIELLSGNPDWQSAFSTDLNRGKCIACTLFVPREYRPKESTKEIEEGIGFPVVLIGGDTLEKMLFTPRDGMFLEASANSQSYRFARIRSIRDGSLLASHESSLLGFWSSRHDSSVHRLTLNKQAYTELKNRLRGNEDRIVWDASLELVVAEGTLSKIGTLGIEVTRGIHLLGGFGVVDPISWDGPDASFHEWVLGLRWYPKLGFEASPLSTRVVVDFQLLHTQGFVTDGVHTWHARDVLLLGATANLSSYEIGAGLSHSFGEAFTQKRPINSSVPPLFFKLGIRFEGSMWKSGHPPLSIAK